MGEPHAGQDDVAGSPHTQAITSVMVGRVPFARPAVVHAYLVRMAQPTHTDRLQRVLSLFLTLRQSWEPLTRADLEDRFPAYREEKGRRRFEDDKLHLDRAGIPIVKTQAAGRPGQVAYTIDADFFLPELGLTEEETVAFALAVRLIDLRDVTWNQLAGTKLGAWAPEGVEAVAHLPTSGLLPHLSDAVAARRRLSFRYSGTDRVVDPYAVVLARGHWYLPAYCHQRDEVRPFRVDRIDADSLVELEDHAFERPADFDPRSVVPLDPRTMGSDPAMQAVLRVDPDFLPIVLADLPARPETTDDGNGHVLVPVTVSHVQAFLGWVLQFGDRVEVVEPAELRQQVIDWLQELVVLDGP